MTMTIEQLRIAISEAANYTDVDGFVSDLLLSPAFLSPADDRAEPDLSQSADLRKVWIGINAPFRDFLAAFGITKPQLSRMFGIPLRTIQEWAGERRHCPIYVRQMIATILMCEKKEDEDAAWLSSKQRAAIIDLYNRSVADAAYAEPRNWIFSKAKAYSKMDAIDRMLRILGLELITDDAERAIAIEQINYSKEIDYVYGLLDTLEYDHPSDWYDLQSDNIETTIYPPGD